MDDNDKKNPAIDEEPQQDDVHLTDKDSGSLGKTTNLAEEEDVPATNEESTLHVANLTRNVKTEHLLEIFSTYGRVKKVDLQIDQRVGLSKGNAYVEFDISKDAEQAMLYLDGGQLDGNILKVSFILISKRTRRQSPERVQRRRSPSPRNTARTSPPRGVGGRGQVPFSRSGPPASFGGNKYGPADNDNRRPPSPRGNGDRDRGGAWRDRDRGGYRGPPARRPSPPRRRDSRDPPLRRRSRSPVRARPRSPLLRRSRSPVRRIPRRESPPPQRRRRSPSSSYSSRSSRSYSSSSASSSESRSRSRDRDTKKRD